MSRSPVKFAERELGDRVQRWPRGVDRGGMGRMEMCHLVAHTCGGWETVVEEESAGWLWGRLREAFPVAAASTLMPNHMHGCYAGEPEQLCDRLRHVLGQHTRLFGTGDQGWTVAPAQPAWSTAILARTAGYIHLNPTRGTLVADPLRWPWSTLRDVMGAVANPWVPASTLGRLLRVRSRDPARVHHDALAERLNRRLEWPMPWVVGTPAALPLAALARACAAALRTTPAAVARRGPTRTLFVHLCQVCGVVDTAAIAAACGTTVRGVQKARHQPRPAGIEAALLCLGAGLGPEVPGRSSRCANSGPRRPGR